MLDPWPSLADRAQDRLSAGAVGDIRCGQVHHQQPAVGVDSNVALASDVFFVASITANACRRSFDGLAVDDRSRWARLAPGPFTVRHQGDVMDSATAAAARSDGTT